MKKTLLLIALVIGSANGMAQEIYTSETLQIEPLTTTVFKHVSHIDIPNYGKFACNGLVVFSDQEAIICDTPTDDKVSKELIDWVQKVQKKKIIAVIVTHFHEDCLGGLQAFHDAHIESYATIQTIQLAKESNKVLPINEIDHRLDLHIGTETVMAKYYGPGHTSDNIVCYLPNQQLLFGGCLIKELDASKGNLADANVAEWSNTVNTIKKELPNLKIVVPGHGEAGGMELLEYTIELFKQPQN